MKRCLADVNVLLALLVRHHENHRACSKMVRWAGGGRSWCLVIQLALIRLLGDSSIMGEYAIMPGPAWALIDELLGMKELFT